MSTDSNDPMNQAQYVDQARKANGLDGIYDQPKSDYHFGGGGGYRRRRRSRRGKPARPAWPIKKRLKFGLVFAVAGLVFALVSGATEGAVAITIAAGIAGMAIRELMPLIIIGAGILGLIYLVNG